MLAAVLLTFIGVSLRQASPVWAAQHTNSSSITIPASGVASTYPSKLNVQGEPGLITDVNLTLLNLSHSFPDDLDILLVSPGKREVLVMSDACGSPDLVGANLTFDDEAALTLPVLENVACTTGSYKPADYVGADGANDILPSPAADRPYATDLGEFDNTSPLGEWELYINDDNGGDGGTLAGGWRLTITTTTAIITMTSLVASEANPYPYDREIKARNGLITDVNVDLQVYHTFPDDMDILLRSPDGDTVILMSDTCGTVDLRGATFTFDQSAADPLPDESLPGPNPCSFNDPVRPTNYGPLSGDNNDWGLPGPHGTSLDDFNGENPNGTWSLFVFDDNNNDTGFITSFSLTITTTNTSTLQIPATSNTDGEGVASQYPYPINVAGETGVVTDVNVIIDGFTHSEPNHVNMLLVSPNGIPVVLMSGACGTASAPNIDLVFNDEETTPADTIPDLGPCISDTYRPGMWDGELTMPSPAPSGPYFDRLSAFDGINPNGTWNLYVEDDGLNDAGFITGAITLIINTTASMTNLVQNNSFASGETNWQEFGGGSGSVVGGVYQFQRTSASDAFTVFQTMTPDFVAQEAFELRFDMRNSGTAQKRITVVIWDEGFGRQRACSFWLDPSATMRTYQILGDVPDGTAWTNATVHFYASSAPPAGNDGFYMLDNVILRRRPDLPSGSGPADIRETLCVDPTAPNGDVGTGTSNLLNNGDFAALPGGNANGTWAMTGKIAGFLDGGTLHIRRTGDPAGSVLQNTDVVVGDNQSIEFSVDLGNSAAIHQRVTILLHNENFDGLQFCTFWILPSTPLGTYIMRTSTNKAWNSQGISASIYPSTSDLWILVDNTSLRVRSDMKTIGTGCYEPGSVQPALDDALWLQEQMGALMQPTLMPTATLAAPMNFNQQGMMGEMPLAATPAPAVEVTTGEGTSSE
jgi:subtilisin-like proprotein convertase family protein